MRLYSYTLKADTVPTYVLFHRLQDFDEAPHQTGYKCSIFRALQKGKPTQSMIWFQLIGQFKEFWQTPLL